MTDTLVTQALDRLRRAADAAFNAFPTTRWEVVGQSGQTLELQGGGGFSGLQTKPGETIHLRCNLELPAEVGGVALAGQPLEAVIASLYPIDLLHDGQLIFNMDGVPVAAGTALINYLPQLKAGDNGCLEIKIHVPDFQTTTWVGVKLTTPALRQQAERLDVAWSVLYLAAHLAQSPEDLQAVSTAAGLVPEQLDPSSKAALDSMAATLNSLQPRIKKQRVHLIGHSHIDMNWLWTWPDTVEVIRRDFKSVLALMDEFPELTFTHSQAATYEVFRQEEPALFEHILKRIREGRWEPATTAWIEGDVNMASGEAHARQMLEGVHYTRTVLGYQPTHYHAPDTFGHAGNLPQLVASGGAQTYYHHRANPGRENQWPAYWWEGQDGTRVLAISTGSYNGEINASDLARAAVRAMQFGHDCGLHFHGIGDHGGGPSRQNLQALARFQQHPLLPTSFCSTIGRYHREIVDSGVRLPEARGESSTIFEGCYTTHADTKLYNRHGENLLGSAETLAVLAGKNQTPALSEAWRKVLFNQFHDILDGSAIHEAYIKNREDFEEVQQTAREVTTEAMAVLGAGTAGQIAVTNPLGFAHTGWVGIKGMPGSGAVVLQGSHGHVTTGQHAAHGLGFVATVPAFSTVFYQVQGSSDAPALQAIPVMGPNYSDGGGILAEPAAEAAYYYIDTPYYTAYVRRNCGVIVSLRDKAAGRELVGFGMRRPSDYIDTARPDLALNVLQLTSEAPHGMSAWQLQELVREESLLSGATTTVIEEGPARLVLEVRHPVRSSSITQHIVFYRDLPRIDFQTSLDWQEVGSSEAGVPGLKAAFTARLLDCEAWYETPFGAVRRPADGQEVPALRWGNVGGADYGIALLNDSKYGYDALGCRLRLTLVRSAYEPDAISDQGAHQFKYALLPHSGTWREADVVQQGLAFNQPLIANLSTAGGKPAAARLPGFKTDPGVIVSCLKTAHDGDGLILRCYDSVGRPGSLVLRDLTPDCTVTETNLVEDTLRTLPVQANQVVVHLNPWQVRTIRLQGT